MANHSNKESHTSLPPLEFNFTKRQRIVKEAAWILDAESKYIGGHNN